MAMETLLRGAENWCGGKKKLSMSKKVRIFAAAIDTEEGVRLDGIVK